MTRVSWLSDRCSPRLPALGSWAVACEGRSPITVAGPRRICTGFLHRHRSTADIVASRLRPVGQVGKKRAQEKAAVAAGWPGGAGIQPSRLPPSACPNMSISPAVAAIGPTGIAGTTRVAPASSSGAVRLRSIPRELRAEPPTP